jgi:hypothetical protein
MSDLHRDLIRLFAISGKSHISKRLVDGFALRQNPYPLFLRVIGK